MTNDRIEYYYKKYKHRVYTYAYKILEMKDSAWVYGQFEDVTQEAFISLKDCYSEIDRAVLKWLFQKVRWQCSNLLKKSRQVSIHHEKIYNSSDDHYWQALEIKSEVIAAVAQALKSIPESRRKIFELKYFQGYESKEIAQMLGIKQATVDVQIFRALKYIREVVKQ